MFVPFQRLLGTSVPFNRSPRGSGAWVLALLLLGFAACGAPGPDPIFQGLLSAGPLSAGPVPPRYQGRLEALSAALESEPDSVAWNMVRRLRAQLLQDASRGMGDLAGAQAFVEGAASVLEGRTRVAACDFVLQFRREDNRPELELVLVLESRWPRELVFTSGAGQLTMERVFVEASGKLARVSKQVALGEAPKWSVVPDQPTEISMGFWPLGMSSEALAGRLEVHLRLLLAEVRDGIDLFSAGGLKTSPAMHVELAAFLPNGALPLQDLVPAVLDQGIGIHGLMERLVRLSPSDYREACDQITALIGRATDLEISVRIAPALRWVTQGSYPGSDPREWRLWARQQILKNSGALDPSGLDLPGS